MPHSHGTVTVGCSVPGMAKGLSFAGLCFVFCYVCTVWKPDQKAPFLSLSDLLT